MIRATMDIQCRDEEHLETITLIINSLEDAFVWDKYKHATHDASGGKDE